MQSTEHITYQKFGLKSIELMIYGCHCLFILIGLIHKIFKRSYFGQGIR